MKISTGLNLLHHVDIGTESYVCKSNLFRINYKLYKIDKVVGRLQVVRKHKERYFQIELDGSEDLKMAIVLYVVAQAQRLWFLRK